MIKFFGSLFFISLLVAEIATSQYSYVDTPAIDVLNDVQNRSDIRFLYRESLISQISLNFSSPSDEIIQALTKQFDIHDITLSGDPNGTQFIIIRKYQEDQNQNTTFTVRGQIVNENTGDRLPFSTLSWHENSQLKGVSATSAGTFHIHSETDEDTFTFYSIFCWVSKKNDHPVRK